MIEHPMRRLIGLLETHPAEMVMFHGTHAGFARRIAKRGFAAKPRERHYSADDPDNYHIASLNGAYFTDQLSVAVGYAFKTSVAFESPGWCAIIMAKVPLIEAVPDEDVINSAMDQAMRQTDNPDDFVRIFHRNLVQDRPIPMQRDLMLKLRDTYAKLHEFEDEDQMSAITRQYRARLDKLTRAYAAMVFETHPVYLGGNHTVRLPKGLPSNRIVSVTTFNIEFYNNDADQPYVDDVKALMGAPIGQDQLEAAVEALGEDWFRFA